MIIFLFYLLILILFGVFCYTLSIYLNSEDKSNKHYTYIMTGCYHKNNKRFLLRYNHDLNCYEDAGGGGGQYSSADYCWCKTNIDEHSIQKYNGILFENENVLNDYKRVGGTFFDNKYITKNILLSFGILLVISFIIMFNIVNKYQYSINNYSSYYPRQSNRPGYYNWSLLKQNNTNNFNQSHKEY